MTNHLANSSHLIQQLSEMSILVADTGDVEAITRFNKIDHALIKDITTNPSLVLKAYQSHQIQLQGLTHGWSAESKADLLLIQLAKKLMPSISGFLSIEINPEYAFNTQKTIESAKNLIEIAQTNELLIHRLLIKIPATWEGIQAAKTLENEGIKTNLTLIFSEIQAQAASDAGVFLISPFVGRVDDWFASKGFQIFRSPGVELVHRIFYLLKSQESQTQIMAASFRDIDQILALSGCDRLTIPPALLNELAIKTSTGKMLPSLDPSFSICNLKIKQQVTQIQFQDVLSANAMASFKLKEGIDRFLADHHLLRQAIT
jgi:transaldolase